MLGRANLTNFGVSKRVKNKKTKKRFTNRFFNIDKLVRGLFYLIVFFISSQVGLHFWPKFSFISGIRIDYLSPTLYLLDILICLWIAICVLKRSFFSNIKFNYTTKVLLILFVLDLILNILLAKSASAHIFGVVKLAEFSLFGILVARNFKESWISGLVYALCSSAIISSILAIWQFVNKSSVGGLWYFWGERTFNSLTIGISTVNLGQQILRPYAAFAHPNLLSFFLFMAVVFSALRFPFEKKLGKIFLGFTILLSSLVILLTFSRIVMLLLFSFIIYEIYTKLKLKYKFASLGFFQITIPFLVLFSLDKYSQFLSRGLDFRQELLVQSGQIFLKNPYFGIGLNNFFVWQQPLIKTISPINFQPPHNIFVVALLSLGLFGFFIFPYLFYLALRSLTFKLRTTKTEQQAFYLSVLVILIAIIIVGFFDHFFVTLEQGEIMLALILGLSFSNMLLPQSSKIRQRKRRK